jgi:hypothetical protein
MLQCTRPGASNGHTFTVLSPVTDDSAWLWLLLVSCDAQLPRFGEELTGGDRAWWTAGRRGERTPPLALTSQRLPQRLHCVALRTYRPSVCSHCQCDTTSDTASTVTEKSLSPCLAAAPGGVFSTSGQNDSLTNLDDDDPCCLSEDGLTSALRRRNLLCEVRWMEAARNLATDGVQWTRVSVGLPPCATVTSLTLLPPAISMVSLPGQQTATKGRFLGVLDSIDIPSPHADCVLDGGASSSSRLVNDSEFKGPTVSGFLDFLSFSRCAVGRGHQAVGARACQTCSCTPVPPCTGS